MGQRTRYAQVGIGGRHEMFRDAILGPYSGNSELVGFCDNNLGRARLSASHVKSAHGIEIPVYAHTDFEKMLEETLPDCVIVTSKDSTHDLYICRAMEMGCNVITEKPMTFEAPLPPELAVFLATLGK